MKEFPLQLSTVPSSTREHPRSMPRYSWLVIVFLRILEKNKYQATDRILTFIFLDPTRDSFLIVISKQCW